jgi:hypothetical protein
MGEAQLGGCRQPTRKAEMRNAIKAFEEIQPQ